VAKPKSLGEAKMAKITEEMKEVAGKTKAFAVATITNEGTPHVIPVAFGKVLSEDELLLVDVFMTKTEENLRANPKIAASFWDMDTLKGYEFQGTARVETSGKVFDDSVSMVKSVFPQFTAKASIIVKVDSIFVRTPGPDAGKRVD
jgi:predicted pyridoxine 5'-phosphate oxidase superfamily flavin-nucleotide-binding protein